MIDIGLHTSSLLYVKFKYLENFHRIFFLMFIQRIIVNKTTLHI